MQKYLKYVPLISLFFAVLGVILYCVCNLFEMQILGTHGQVTALQAIFDSSRYVEDVPNISALLCFIFMVIGFIDLVIYLILFYKNKGSEKVKDILFWGTCSLAFAGFIGFFAKSDYIAHVPQESQKAAKALIEITAGYIIGCVSLLVASLVLIGLYLFKKFYKPASESKSE